MIPEVTQAAKPHWLYTDKFVFDVHKVLKDSLYYPSSGYDGKPIKFFTGNVYSFVYVDQSTTPESLQATINKNGIKGYKQIHKQDIPMHQLIPNGWSVVIKPQREHEYHHPANYRSWIKPGFCQWFIFEATETKDGEEKPTRFSLLFLCGDGPASYQALYLSNRIKPKIVAILQPGHGFGGNWTNYRDPNAIFAKSVTHNRSLMPDYLVDGGNGYENSYTEPIWDDYPTNIANKGLGKYGWGMGVFEKGEFN
jgi:hypothetical protein